jgi:cell division protein FtsW
VGHSVSSSSESFRRWISIGGFTFQPSEFAKIAIVVYLASTLEKSGDMDETFNTRRLLFPFILISTVLLAIALEPQYGTAICLLAVIIVMIYIAGFPIMRLFLIFASSVPFLFLFAIYRQYRLKRLLVWLDPYGHRYEGGYQLVTSFRAFRDGGFFGEDLAYGFAHRYLTYGHTDFILALHAENFGWFGSMALIGLFCAFLWRGVYGIKRIRDPFLFLLASGSIVMIILQAILNMGVVTGALPTTGVSLPFVSYGGSSLVSTLAFCGLIINALSNGRDNDKN